MKLINLVLYFLLLLELFFVNGENSFMSLLKKYSSSEAGKKDQSPISAKINKVGQHPSPDNNVVRPRPTNSEGSSRPANVDVKINNKYVVLNALDQTVFPHVLFVANHLRENIPGAK